MCTGYWLLFFSGLIVTSAVNIIRIPSNLVPIYTVVQRWLLATDHNRIGAGLSLSLHPCSKIDYQYFMETRALLDDPTPMVTCPLHHTVSVTLINLDSEQCGEGRPPPILHTV